MTPEAQAKCRAVLDRMQAQLTSALPPATFDSYSGTGTWVPDSTLPVERLPLVSDAVAAYVQSEALLAEAVRAGTPEQDGTQ